MSGPFEYREVMQAHMRYGETRTVEQVIADQKKRHESGAATRRSADRSTAAPTPISNLPQSEVDKVRAMLAKAAPRPAPPSE